MPAKPSQTLSSIQPIDSTGLWALNLYFGQYQTQLNLITHAEVTSLVAALAEKIITTLGLAAVRELPFAAIPRGGHLVLGMLAYALGLKPEQTDPLSIITDGVGDIAIVDDCALTGHRFKAQLSKLSRKRVHFFHLYSSPVLRETILNREPMVSSCLAAADLPAVTANGQQPADLSKLAQHWGSDRYVIDTPVQPIFPWNEPSMPVVMPFSDAVYENWQLFPPHLILKNRFGLGLPPKPTRDRAWQAPSRIAYRWDGTHLTILQLEAQQNYGLIGWQADVWRGLSVYGSEQLVLEWLSSHHLNRDEDTIEARFRHSRDQLVAAQLLEKSD